MLLKYYFINSNEFEKIMLLKYYFINSNEFEKDKQLSSPRWAYWVSKAFISVVGGPQNGTYSFLCEYTM